MDSSVRILSPDRGKNSSVRILSLCSVSVRIQHVFLWFSAPEAPEVEAPDAPEAPEVEGLKP